LTYIKYNGIIFELCTYKNGGGKMSKGRTTLRTKPYKLELTVSVGPLHDYPSVDCSICGEPTDETGWAIFLEACGSSFYQDQSSKELYIPVCSSCLPVFRTIKEEFLRPFDNYFELLMFIFERFKKIAKENNS
jgi:hypothetical protein